MGASQDARRQGAEWGKEASKGVTLSGVMGGKPLEKRKEKSYNSSQARISIKRGQVKGGE